MVKISRMAVLATFVVVSGAVLAQSGDQRQVHVETQKAALARPFDQAAFKRYLQSLATVVAPEGIVYYIVEGDVLMTLDEVREHLVTVGGIDRESAFTPELILNTRDGRDDYWQARERRRLTYAIDRKSFSDEAQYRQIVENMAAAGREWERACEDCGIRFEYRADYNDAPSHEKVTFIVRSLNAAGKYVAASFFPSTPVFRRYVNIDPSYFRTQYDMVGVLVHELGHVLGYRHEHTRDVRGCYYEDNEWKPLTEYDPRSVMHYFCGGGGSLKLSLSDLDRKGHRNLYGADAASPYRSNKSFDGNVAQYADPQVQTLRVRLEGGDIAENILKVALALAKEGVLQTTSYSVRSGDAVCTVLSRAMGFPDRIRCPQNAQDLFAFLNPRATDVKGLVLSIGQVIRVPANFKLQAYTYTRTYNLGVKSDATRMGEDRARWNFIEALSDKDETRRRLKFEGYEISLPFESRSAGQKVMQALDHLGSANVYVGLSSDKSLSGLRLHSRKPSEYMEICRKQQGDPGEVSYSQFFGLDTMPACALTCVGGNCSQIYLVDNAVLPNPDLKDAISSGVDFPQVATPAVPGNRQFCVENTFTDAHHGTHLAGIMVSQPNGYGFIGVSPKSKLHAVSRDGLDDASLGDLIEREVVDNEEADRKLFVFAGNFPPYETRHIDTSGRLSTPDIRFTRNQAAARIRDSQPLWITAIGQAGPDESPKEVFANSPMAPMNLGQLKNVVVVTACEDCSDGMTRLMSGAHFSASDQLVALAAPGHQIVGLADRTSIATADGTSQATAFVAGVAAAMHNCHPRAYRPDRIKNRLILTSRQVLGESDYSKVRSGVVDPEMALLDPSKNWLKRFGGALAEAEILGWCRQALSFGEFFDRQDLPSETYLTSKIRRITRYRRTMNGAGALMQWVVFRQLRSQDADYTLERSRPGTMSTNTKLLMLGGANPSVITLGDVEELLLSKPITKEVNCP